MTYGVGGLIQASDLNTFLSTGTPNLNNIWATGAGNAGYGQTALPTVAISDPVTAAQWSGLINTIARAASHQGTPITSIVAPNVGQIISYIAALPTNLNLINTSRLNASVSGSTSTNIATNSTPWLNTLTMTFSVVFANNNAARYFFNSGGQLGLSFSHPTSVGINIVFQDICNEIGTIWLSSPTNGSINIAGTQYNGITKVGGVTSGRGVANPNNGFYALTSTPSQCYQQTSDQNYYYYYYGGNEYLRISAAYNGSGTLTLICLFDNQAPQQIAAGTVGTLTVRPPSTTYLSNSWGTPTLTNSITRT